MRLLRISCVALVVIGCARTAPVPVASTSSTSADITERDLESRLFKISHASMMGRETGSEGNYKAAEYIAGEFRRLGLKPEGENGTYFQTLPFYVVAPDQTSSIEAGGTMLTPRDFLPLSRTAAPRSFEGKH